MLPGGEREGLGGCMRQAKQRLLGRQPGRPAENNSGLHACSYSSSLGICLLDPLSRALG